MQDVLFYEKQHFRQWWLLTIAIASFVLLLWIYFRDYANPATWPHSVAGLAIGIGICMLTLVFFLIAGLETKIQSDGIYVRFFPFHIQYKKYPWRQLSEVYVRKYSPIREYGGWGLRGMRNNRAFNVSGNQGIQMLMHDGRKLLIGTRKPEEATKALTSVWNRDGHA